MIIKIALIAAALGIAVFLLREKEHGHRQALRRVVGLLVVLAGITAVLWPDLTSRVANLVGVDRGTDLVLYGLVVVFAYTSLATAQRIHLLEVDIRALTRELALATAARPQPIHAPTDDDPPVVRTEVGVESSTRGGRPAAGV